jgi:hypothetical protein
MKLEIEDFIFEVKEELVCYEEMGESGADKWESEFREWLNNADIKKKNVSKKGNEVFFAIDDESEIFDIADSYLDAVENNSVEEFWKKFQ